MKPFLLAISLAGALLLEQSIIAQTDYFKTGTNGQAEVTLFNINTANILDRGSAFVNSSFIKGAISVSDYSGNLTLGHSMEIPYPNDLKSKLTLVFNANASHAYFEDFLGRYNRWGFPVDERVTGTTVRENAVNAACWVLGINGIALQTTNFEENFFLGTTDDPTQENPSDMYFTGTQVPLLATGYQYTNDVSFPWNDPERGMLVTIPPNDSPPGVTVTDKIRIMNSEGSVLTLINPTPRSNSSAHDTTRWDYHLTGVYLDADEKSNGYAIVKWIDQIYALRKFWYKPGDGLTYYFEEEFPTYQNLGSWSAWGGRETNRPKIAYLRNIRSQNGDMVTFSYDYQNVFSTNATRGRKFLKSIQYYKSGAPVAGTAITFSYVKNANNTYQINIQNALSGESYSVGLNNYSPANDGGFDNIVRNSAASTTNIMQVNSITNNNRSSKNVSFAYDTHIRRYTYGTFDPASYICGIQRGCAGGWCYPTTCEGHYYLTYPTKMLTSREVYHGEKETFAYWTSTQLDDTPLYDATSSYSVADAWWHSNDVGYCGASKPWEYSTSQGYYINTYLNNPDASYKYYRYFLSNAYEWQLYLSGYHYGNMDYSLRDNYTSVMMKTLTTRVFNDQTSSFDPISQRDYAYTWGHTMYWGANSQFAPRGENQGYISPPFIEYSNQTYCDISPRITNIKTSITTTNLTTEQNSAQHSYTDQKTFELLKVASKFRLRYRPVLTPSSVTTETRITAEAVYDQNNTLLQSVAYDYNTAATSRCPLVNNASYLLYYEPAGPNDLGLKSKATSYSGVLKAIDSSAQSITTFGVGLSFIPPDGFWPDSCIVKNLLQDTSTTSEQNRSSSDALSMKKVSKFTSDFGITASTSYTDTNFVYRPALPTEQTAFVRKGTSGSYNRKSRTGSSYWLGGSVNYGKLFLQAVYGAIDSPAVRTIYVYDSTGTYSGYLRKILNDNGSDVRYLYNTEVTPTGKLFCSNGTTVTNPSVSWSSAFQAAPFETIKDYDGKSMTAFTAYDGKSNLFFSVDENGYYSANYYDGIGRLSKQLKPGTFAPNSQSLPTDSSSAPQGSMTVGYDDGLWTPQVTTTAYRDIAGTNVRAMSKFRPDSMAFESYAIDGGSQVLKSKEKVNYLGKKWYSQDGDGIRAFYYYDALLNLRQTRFADSTTGAANAQQTVDYTIDNCFKRVRLTDENGNLAYNYFDVFGNTLKSERCLGTKILTTSFAYDNLARLLTSTTPEGKVTTHYYDVRGNDSVRISPDAGTALALYDKYGNVRLIKDANHTGTGTNPGTIISQAGSVNASGSFTLNMPGTVSLLITFGAGSPSGTISITKNGATLCSATNTGSGTVANSIILPKGSYGWSFTKTVQGGGYYTYSVTCGNTNEFVYNKYDGLNRLTETGEYQVNSLADFTQANADNVAFPSTNTVLTKKLIYDTISGDPRAAGQRNVSGKLSETDAYRLGQLCNQTFYSYDELGRVEWEVQWGLGTYAKKLYYQYDLQGNVTQKKYADLAGNCNMYTLYDYDQQGRLLRVWTATDSLGAQKVKEGEYAYTTGNRVQQLLLGVAPAQTVDYTYNSRGWLRKINDPDALGTDKFAMTLGYDAQDKTGGTLPFTAQKNGNVSWITYRMAGVNLPYGSTDYVCRSFSYDSTSRLLRAPFGYCFGSNWYGAGSRYGEFYSYSDDGDFLKLGRHDSTGTLTDSLTYSYTSGTHRLTSYTNSAGSGSSYTYDDNGNVVSDSRSNIAFAIYDINNLPFAVYMTNGVSQTYAYDVNGSRVRKNPGNGTDTYYVNDPTGKTELVQKGLANNVYTYNIWGADNLGMALRNGPSVNRLYTLKDHLGSVRMTMRVDSTVLADEFSGTLSQWTTVLGSGFTIVGGELSNNAGNDNVAVNASPALFADGIVGADVTNLTGLAADANIVFRYQNPSNYYMVQAYNTQVMIFKKVAGTYYNVSNYNGPTQFLGGPYKLQASISGRTITVYWKGQQVLNWTDTDPNNVWMSGKVGVRQCSGRTIHWDNFYAITTCPAQVVAYDDFYPFGLVMPQRSSNAGLADTRYKFTGKERDAAETGYDYFGARYYDSRIGRFLAVDPHAGRYPGMSPFCYVGNNPLAFVDPTGMDSLSDARAAEARGKASADAALNDQRAKLNPILGWFFSFAAAFQHDKAGEYTQSMASAEEAVTQGSALVGTLVAGEVLESVGGEPMPAKPNETIDELTSAANRAVEIVGEGKGAVYGTRVHSAFETEVNALGRSDLATEQSYLNGRWVERGTAGSVRADVVLGPVKKPLAIFDLKTGSASLTPARIQQFQQNVPDGTRVAIHMIRPD